MINFSPAQRMCENYIFPNRGTQKHKINVGFLKLKMLFEIIFYCSFDKDKAKINLKIIKNSRF